jgi:hypothetical protein
MALAPLVGMIGAPLLEGVVGGSVLGLSTGALGAGLSGLTGLVQGKDPISIGLDALGGYGGASGIADLAKSGAASAATQAGQAAINAPGVALEDATIGNFNSAAAAATPANPMTLANVQQGVSNLMQPGGIGGFSVDTGKSALKSLGMPAAGALMGAMSPTGSLMGLTPTSNSSTTQESYYNAPLESLESVRQRARGYAEGGITDLGMAGGGAFDARTKLPAYDEPMDAYAKGGVLSGPGDGVSDSIPAVIGNKQPARLADGEFVIPARIVSELGNGSTKAGAQRLYEMMDRVKKRREKSVGKHSIAVDTKAYKELPA